MNSVVVVFFAVAATVLSVPLEADRFPANLNPALCPDYPICDNALIHGELALPLPIDDENVEIQAPSMIPELPAIDGPSVQAEANIPPFNLALLFPNYVATMWPEGVHPASCPNYPFCNSVSKIVLPLPGFTERLYPPGVSASACPNYPDC